MNSKNNFSLGQLIFIVFCAGFLYLIRDIALVLFISIILTVSLSPLISSLESRNIPRGLSIIGVFGLFFILLGVFLNSFLDLMIREGANFILRLPSLSTDLVYTLGLEHLITEDQVNLWFENSYQNIPTFIQSQTSSFVGLGQNVLDISLHLVTFTFITFYMIYDWEKIREFFISFAPSNNREGFVKVLTRVENKLGAWLRGQFVLMFAIGLITYIGLITMQVKFALPLAIIAGVLEIVPIIGPTIAVIPAVIVGASPESPSWQVFAVILLYIFIQQFEANLIVPKVMNNAVGIHPILVILAVMIGTKIAGPTGAIVSIPVTAICMIFYEEWLKVKK